VTFLPAGALPAISHPGFPAILAAVSADAHALGAAVFHQPPAATAGPASSDPDRVIPGATASLGQAVSGTTVFQADPPRPVPQASVATPAVRPEWAAVRPEWVAARLEWVVARVVPVTPVVPAPPASRPKAAAHRLYVRPRAAAAALPKPIAVIHPLHPNPSPARVAVPVASSTPLSSGGGTSVHVVAAGESLWEISRAAGVSVASLAQTNHLSEGASLHPGQMLEIPAAAVGAVPVPPRAAAPQVAARTHRVTAGETLWKIARDGGIDVRVLAAANRLSESGPLRVGQVITVPPPGTRLSETVTAVSAPALGDRTAIAISAASAVVKPGAPNGAYRFGMVWPSAGIVSSRFGWRLHPIFRTREFHTGVDIATRWGSPVRAARDGIVQFVGWVTGYGRLIVVNHGNGLVTFYSHLSSALVGDGQRVNQGQIIGRIGNTGWSTGPHLFFEVRRDGVPVDPTRYLR